MDWVSSLAIVVGVATIVFVLIAYLKGEFSRMEDPKYEMLGLEKPDRSIEIVRGRIGVEDRIIRLGLVGAAFYYSTRIGGWEVLPGMLLSIFGAYLFVTGIWGRDPIYMIFRWDTQMADQ